MKNNYMLHIGDKVYDTVDRRYGFIALIGGEDKDTEITEDNYDIIVTLMDAPTVEERYSEWETTAEDLVTKDDEGWENIVRYKVSEIVYDTDGEDVSDLPVEMEFDVVDDDFNPDIELADMVSDQTGWCVESFEWSVVYGEK